MDDMFIEAWLHQQELVQGFRDLRVLQTNPSASVHSRGFVWKYTFHGHGYWERVISLYMEFDPKPLVRNVFVPKFGLNTFTMVSEDHKHFYIDELGLEVFDNGRLHPRGILSVFPEEARDRLRGQRRLTKQSTYTGDLLAFDMEVLERFRAKKDLTEEDKLKLSCAYKYKTTSILHPDVLLASSPVYPDNIIFVAKDACLFRGVICPLPPKEMLYQNNAMYSIMKPFFRRD